MLKTTILLITLLALSGTAEAGFTLMDFRDEVVTLRLELIERMPEDEKAARHAESAIKSLGPVLELIDELDPELVSGMFSHLSKAMKKMESAARKEKSESFTAFVADWNERIWVLTSTLLAPDNPAVTNPDADDLQIKFAKKLGKAGKRAVRGRLASAVKKLGPAWKLHVRIERIL